MLMNLASKELNFLFMHGKKVFCRGRWCNLSGKISCVCVRKHKLFCMLRRLSESLPGIIISFSCVQLGYLPSGPSLHAVIYFFQQNFIIIIFYQFFFEKILGICVFLSAIYFLEIFEKKLILQSYKDNPGCQCLFFFFFSFSSFFAIFDVALK
jgi:hypothetical protein